MFHEAPKNLKLVFIGSGNLATQLAVTFAESQYSVLQIYSRTEEAAAILAEKVKCPYTTNIGALDRNADIYICALKDDVLQDVLSHASLANKLVIHTAGTLPMDVLSPFTSRYGVFYPLQTFSKNKRVDFSAIPVFIESNNDDDLQIIKLLAGSVSGAVYEASSLQRQRLHLAAVFACNFVNHFYAIAAGLVEKSDFSFDVLLPLISETAEKLHYLTPREAQTGPAIRYDNKVIDKHLNLLETDITTQQLYKLISEHIYKYGKF